jgi:23S rRNA (adenine2503-C2)-methyltransferase
MALELPGLDAAPVRPVALQGFLPEELSALCRACGQAAFRGKQLWQWLQQRGARGWGEMTNIPKVLAAALEAAGCTASPLEVAAASGETEGGTRKLLGRLVDGECVETVVLPSKGRQLTVCVSTEVGCKMGCAFCASGKGGFARRLSAGEIVAQVGAAGREAGLRPDHVVFMGMGEPFDNYDEVLRAVRVLNHPEGLGIGARKLTLSTSGVVPGIRRLAEEGLQVELSVSLHAADPETRRRLMPVERKWPMAELLAACAAYTRKTKRIVTFEYTLIRGVNDRSQDVAALAEKLRLFPCRVNLIPLSPVAEFDGEAPPPERCEAFLDSLARRGIPGTLRRSRGKGVDAACGQLRRRFAAKAEKEFDGKDRISENQT